PGLSVAMCTYDQFLVRRFSKRLSNSLFIGIFLSCLYSINANAQTIDRDEKPKESGVEECSIKNFGKVNDHFFRGAQPKGDEYGQLAKMGIKTVIDLREHSEDFARDEAKEAGM